MVGTRGRKSTRGSLSARKVPHSDNNTIEEPVEIRPRKRQRNNVTPQGEDHGVPASKRQAVAIAPSPSLQKNAAASPSSTRQRPTLTTPQGPPYLQHSGNFHEQSSPIGTTIPTSSMPTIMPITFEEAASNALSEYANNDLSLMNYASQGYEQMGVVDTASFLPGGASVHVKIQSLPVLDNLATQILNIIAKSSYQEVINMALKPDSEPGSTFGTLKDLFTHAKKVYSQTEPFLDAHALRLVDNAHVDTVRKANMATFVISILGSQDVGFYHLNEYFIDTFVPSGHQLLKTQAEIFLELKTQAYISAVMNSQRGREAIVEELFPIDMEKKLLERRPEAKQLSPSEKDFAQRAQNRRKVLLDEPDTVEAMRLLPQKYVWADFLKEVSTYISKNFDTIANEPARKTSRPQRAIQPAGSQSTQHNPSRDDIADKAERAALVAMQGFATGPDTESPNPRTMQQYPTNGANPSQSATPQPNQPELQFHFERPLHPNVPGPQKPYFHNVPYQSGQGQWYPGTPSDPNWIPYPTQSAPTKVLYERARMVSASKPSGNARKSGGPAQRRPWTLEEENALMAGLDRVKGPHWAQILAMFGRGGTISEILKDRGQVQLKDKARNLKLFFLKSNIEVPYYLQFVTGELKTRAPAQAARREAMDKQISEEDRAHVEGIMALAGGSQNYGDPYDQRPTDFYRRPRKAPQSDVNVDPSLDTMQQDPTDSNANAYSAQYGASTAGNVAPDADMLSGRQSMPQEQYQQGQQQMQPNQRGGFQISPRMAVEAANDPGIGASTG